jgi:hypothetical protein
MLTLATFTGPTWAFRIGTMVRSSALISTVRIGKRLFPKVRRLRRSRHAYVAPELFTAKTPLGTYQGMTDQIVLSRTPGAFRTVLVPRGSSKPEWLSPRK